MQAPYSTSAYRNPDEIWILAVTLGLVGLVILVTAVATVCGSALFAVLGVALAASASRAHHQALMRRALPVTHQTQPDVARLAEACLARLQPGPVEIYITPSRELNAYTFGLSDPKVVVLYSQLFEVMDADELRFILGHELGHVRLGHTRLNSLVGGLAGIPASSSASAILALAFLGWNRACETSADRAGLLACGQPEKAVSALVKLVAGPHALSQTGLELAYRQIDAEDDTFLGSLGEALGSHPLLIKRITAIRRYAATAEYRRLQALVDQNLA
jgi:Zn-dependent protease with chaperone function